MLSEATLKQAIVDGIIDTDFHDQLLVKIGQWTRTAGISEEDVLLRLSHHCGEREQKWFRQWKSITAKGCYGIYYTGSFAPEGFSDVGLRMRAITAGFLRNYVDARVMRCEKAFDATCTVLCIPDFGVQPGEYVRQRIASLLLARASESKPTVLHVADPTKLESYWGKAVADLLTDSYQGLKLG